MARNDGVDRTSARNVNLSETKIGNAQRHNEREKESYTNPDIVQERSELNVHFKTPIAGYVDMFSQMEANKTISTRGLKDDAAHYGELIFDVNTAYFHNHGGYDFAKQFYADTYKSAIEIVGGEQYILSAVMHADERNRAMSEALGQDVYHYHLHVVYVPVVEKQILWSKRCKDESLRGTVKETIVQVSSSKKWLSKPALDGQGKPILQKNGKPVLRKSYSVLQDDFFNAMKKAGYHDVERGEHGSAEEHLTVTQFKVGQEQARLEALDAKIEKKVQTLEKLQKQQVSIKAVEQIEVKPIPLSSKVAVEKEDYQMLVTAAKKYVTQERKESKLQSLLKAAEAKIVDLTAKLAAVTKELSEYKSIRGKLKSVGLEQENVTLRETVGWYRSVIEKQGIGHLFNRQTQHQQDRDSR